MEINCPANTCAIEISVEEDRSLNFSFDFNFGLKCWCLLFSVIFLCLLTGIAVFVYSLSHKSNENANIIHVSTIPETTTVTSYQSTKTSTTFTTLSTTNVDGIVIPIWMRISGKLTSFVRLIHFKTIKDTGNTNDFFFAWNYITNDIFHWIFYRWDYGAN